MIRWEELGARLDAARHDGRAVVLSTHVNPDGDGLGCEIALHAFLKERGNRAYVINNDPVPEKYRFLKGSEEILVFEEARCGEILRQAGVFIVLDNGSAARLGRLLPELKASGAFKVCIDHHPGPDPFWDLLLVDEEVSASGHLVYQAIRALGGSIDPAIAEALYVSFVTDTGHFRFNKTTAEVHRVIADLMEQGGISPPKVYRALFEGISPGLNRIVAYALADSHYEYGGRFAWARLTRRQLEECEGLEEDTSDLVNMLLAVKGVVAAALFKELPEGRTKVSLRSLGDVNVNGIASRLGGGGHRNASGILMTAPLDQGVRQVVEGMKEVVAPG